MTQKQLSIVTQQGGRAGFASRAARRSDDKLTLLAVWLLAFAAVINEVLGQTQLISLGFYTLHVVDPAVVMIIASCLVRATKKGRRSGLITLPILVIGALLWLNLARGVVADVAPALLWARANLALASLLPLALLCQPSVAVTSGVKKAVLAAALAIAVLAFMRLILGPGLFMTVQIDATDINDGGRALSAGGAFMLGLGAALAFSDFWRSGKERGRSLLLTIVLSIAELASGQGTATLAMLAMLAIVGTLERGILRGPRLAAGPVIAFFLVVAVQLVNGSGLLDSTVAGFDLSHRAANLETRHIIWQAFLQSFDGMSVLGQAIGLPGGQTPSVIVYLSGRLYEWQLGLHSMYYGSLVTMGLVGLSAFIVLLVVLAVRLFIAVLTTRKERQVPAYALAIVLGTGIFSYAYDVRNGQLLGLFVAIVWYRVGRQQASSSIMFEARFEDTSSAETTVR